MAARRTAMRRRGDGDGGPGAAPRPAASSRSRRCRTPAPAFARGARGGRAADQGRPGPARAVNVLVYDPDEGELVRVSVPIWLAKKIEEHADHGDDDVDMDDEEREHVRPRAWRGGSASRTWTDGRAGTLIEVEEDGRRAGARLAAVRGGPWSNGPPHDRAVRPGPHGAGWPRATATRSRRSWSGTTAGSTGSRSRICATRMTRSTSCRRPS